MVIMNSKKVIITIIILLLVNGIVFSQKKPGTGNPLFEDTMVENTDLPNDSLTIDSANIKLFIDKIEVNVQLEKPQALFILPGSTPDIDDIQIEHSFFNEIFRPVEKRGRIQTDLTTETDKNRKDYIPW